jgi:cytochrome c oxidase cbb3-type subunit III
MDCIWVPRCRRLIVRAAPVLLFALWGHAQTPDPAQTPGSAPTPTPLRTLGPGQTGARPRSSVGSQGPLPVHQAYPASAVANGATLFVQQCGFCHGKDAGGGESGPDLTRSKLVSTDQAGENIGPVIRNGRPQKMPGFALPDSDLTNLEAFIHYQQDQAMSQSGNRKGVDTADLQTGNVEAGKKYFNGAGTCSKCHSETRDLAGIASRYQGLRLEQQMLVPRNAKSKVTVTTAAGKVFTGTLAYRDEFTVGLMDEGGAYHSWPTAIVKYKIDSPTEAHVELLKNYTDDDIHNLMAYLQTLR